jgi:hypothetical protein
MFGFVRAIIIATAAFIGIFLGTFVGTPEEATAPRENVPAIVTVQMQEEATQSPTTSEIEEPAPEQEKPKPEVQKPEEKTPISFPDSLPTLPNVFVPATSSQKSLNEMVREATVNIICITTAAGPLNPISASGVIIDPRGIILTNAHVAQYLLLKDYIVQDFVECTVRTGSPAMPKYTVELLFIPPSWVIENAEKLNDESPRGNGEHDYALLRITGTTHSTIPLPSSFPSLNLATTPPETGTSVLIAGYPAGFLGGITIQKDLYAASANALVGPLYTYETASVDLFSVGGSILAQQGSSGGAVALQNGLFTGLIVTSSEGETTGARELRALASSYIIRDFEAQKGVSLVSFFGRNLATEAQLFKATAAPTLTKLLTDVLDK